MLEMWFKKYKLEDKEIIPVRIVNIKGQPSSTIERDVYIVPVLEFLDVYIDLRMRFKFYTTFPGILLRPFINFEYLKFKLKFFKRKLDYITVKLVDC